jgi:hypothetical protein
MMSKERRRLVKVFDGMLMKQLLSYCTFCMVVSRVKVFECPLKRGIRVVPRISRPYFGIGIFLFIHYFYLSKGYNFNERGRYKCRNLA